jgi:drug/metabolite transporter (DMT)-like permease
MTNATDAATPAGARAWAAYTLLAAAMAAWSGNITLVRAVHETVPPLGLAFWRSVVTAVVLLPLVAWRWRQDGPPLLRHWRLIAAIGILQYVAGQALMYVALQTTTSVNAGLLNATQPAMIVLVAWAIAGERLSARQLGGIGLALVGVVVIVLRGEWRTLVALDFVVGDLLVVLALLAWSFYSALVRRLPPTLHPLSMIAAASVAAVVGLAPIYAADRLYAAGPPMTFSGAPGLVLAYVALVAGVFGVAAWNGGIARIGASRASSFLYLIPVMTSVFGVVLLAEAFHAYHAVGVALVFAGVWITNRTRAAAL